MDERDYKAMNAENNKPNNMKKTIIIILIFTLVLYLLFAFVTWNFNPFYWMGGRIFYAFCWTTMLALTFIHHEDSKHPPFS